MGTIPDATEVRAYLKVPTTALSDEDLERMRLACLTDQAARCSWPGLTRTVGLALDGMTATVAIRGGVPGRVYLVSWAAGVEDQVPSDGGGNATAAHTYPPDTGSVAVWVRDATTMDTLGALAFEVPGTWAQVDASNYPDALAQALLRRVQREVAARNLPLGMVGLDASEYGPTRLPYLDSLVEEHERAFRRVVLA